MAAIRSIAAAMIISLGLPMAALAGGNSAEQGAELLARAQSLDAKCNFLDARGKDKLSKFTARAELALVNRETMEATVATMKRGHDAGRAADCSAAEKDALQQILAVAMQATGEDKKTARLAASPAPQPVDAQPKKTQASQAVVSPLADDARKVDSSAPMAPPAANFPKVKEPMQIAAAKPVTTKPTSPGLGTYERLTQAYYLVRRCGGGDLGRTYQAVVAEHGRVMASHTAAEVSAVLHRAEARAASATCS